MLEVCGMKILENHFNNEMSKNFSFNAVFNSHQINILKKCNIDSWVQLLSLYETMCDPMFNRYITRLQIVVGEDTITIPKKLSDSIYNYISVYFGKRITKTDKNRLQTIISCN